MTCTIYAPCPGCDVAWRKRNERADPACPDRGHLHTVATPVTPEMAERYSRAALAWFGHQDRDISKKGGA